MIFSLLVSAALARPMTLDEAVRAAEDNNPGLAGARHDLRAAEARAWSARGMWDPALTLTAGRSFNISESSFSGLDTHAESTDLLWTATLGQTLPTGTSWNINASNSNSLNLFNVVEFGVQDTLYAQNRGNLSVGVSQQLLEGHRMAYNLETVRQAEAARSFAEARLRSQRQSTLLDVSRAYFELVYADTALDVAARAVEVATEERRIVQAQVAAGNLAPVEATRVDAAVAQARLALIEAENARAAANDALALLVGALGEDLEPTTSTGAGLSHDVDADRAVEAAVQGNPGLELARLQVEDAELSVVASRHALLPSLSLDARFGYSGFTQLEDGTRRDTRSDAWGKLQSGDFPDRYVGATFTVPLGMRAERGDLQARSATVSSQQASLESQQLGVEQQVRTLVRTLTTAAQRIELAELNLRLARETLAAEKARQEAGRAVQKDVLEAQRAVSDSELALLRARTDYAIALAELQALQGKL